MQVLKVFVILRRTIASSASHTFCQHFQSQVCVCVLSMDREPQSKIYIPLAGCLLYWYLIPLNTTFPCFKYSFPQTSAAQVSTESNWYFRRGRDHKNHRIIKKEAKKLTPSQRYILLRTRKWLMRELWKLGPFIWLLNNRVLRCDFISFQSCQSVQNGRSTIACTMYMAPSIHLRCTFMPTDSSGCFLIGPFSGTTQIRTRFTLDERLLRCET